MILVEHAVILYPHKLLVSVRLIWIVRRVEPKSSTDHWMDNLS